MPVDVLIYVTTGVALSNEEFARLNSDLLDQVGADRFDGPGDCALSLVPAGEREGLRSRCGVRR